MAKYCPIGPSPTLHQAPEFPTFPSFGTAHVITSLYRLYIYILNVQHWYGKCIPWADFLDISWYSKVPSTSQQLRHFSMPSGAGAQGNSGPTMETAPDGSIFRTLGRHDWAWGQGMVLAEIHGFPMNLETALGRNGREWCLHVPSTIVTIA